jgi:hypothetical protein
MKLALTEKQYNDLLTVMSKIQLGEQSDPPAAEPEKGTSDKQAGGQGYPAVGKWESGVTRGPANQVGVTKWADVVGAKLTRSKGNQLKEQEGRGSSIAMTPDENRKYIDNFEKFISPSGYFYVPKGTKIISKYAGVTLKMDNWDKDPQLKKWLPVYPNNPLSYQEMLPDIGSAVYSFKTPDGIVYSGEIKNEILEKVKSLEQFYKLTPDPSKWMFGGYFDSNGKKFKLGYWQNVGIYWSEVWEEHSFDIMLMIGSVVAALITGGLANIGWLGVAAETGAMTAVEGLTYRAFYMYIAEGLVWTGGGIYEFQRGNKGTGAMDILFGTLLPVLHFKWGIFTGLAGYTEKEVADIGKMCLGKSPQELESVFYKFTPRQKEIFRRIMIIPKNEWEAAVKKAYEEASIKFEKLGLKPAEKLEEIYFKVGNFVQKKWYLNLPLSLTRDFMFLGVMEVIFKKYKIEDTPMGDKAVGQVSAILTKASTPEQKEESAKQILEIVQKNKEINAMSDSLQKLILINPTKQNPNYDTTGNQASLDSIKKKVEQK